MNYLKNINPKGEFYKLDSYRLTNRMMYLTKSIEKDISNLHPDIPDTDKE